MIKLKYILLTATVAGAIAMKANSVETPLWLRNPAISPDGTTVAFTYKGDIYTVNINGGNARQITSSPAYDSAPFWSPDGKRIAFVSDREGSLDIYITDAFGGTPVRITTHSGNEQLRGWLDNTHLIFSSQIQPSSEAATGAFLPQTYIVEATQGARPSLFMSIPVTAISAGNNRILFQDRKGYEDVLRKHERSSGTADIWLLTLGDDRNPTNGTFTRLTEFNGQDQSPAWNGSASDNYYYVSEEGNGTLNVFSASLDTKEKKQLTNFDTHPVRSLSASADGQTLTFSQNGRLWRLNPGSEPSMIDVIITADNYTPDAVKSIRRSGASSIAVSPQGDEIAFVLRGNVYVTSTDYTTTRQITSTPQQERTVDFSPDGRTLVYDSERDGIWQIFTASISNPDEDTFTYATEIEEKPLYKSDKPSFQPAFSPDGKKVAFLEDRTILRVIDIDSKNVNTALDGKFNYSYTDGDVEFSWSPDSKWFLTSYIGIGGWNNSDIALVAADGSSVTDLTNSGYNDSNPKWALDGKAMTWESDRAGYRSHGSWGAESDVYIMFFDADAYDSFRMTKEEAELVKKQKEKQDENSDDNKKKDSKSKKKNKKSSKKGKGDKDDNDDVEPLTFDLANAPYRIVRLTDNSSRLGDHYLDTKGENFYYGTGGDLYIKKIRDKETKVLAKGKGRGGFAPTKEGKSIFVISSSGINKIDLPGGDSEKVEFEAPLALNSAAERQYIFDHMHRQVADKFYDENLHGVDWEMYGNEYRKFLPHINNNYDFAELLSEILGELNASHTGGRYSAPGASMSTASLGAFFDENYTGNGLRIKEIMQMGPLATAQPGVNVGEIITEIDGQPIVSGRDYYPLLEGKAGKKTRLTVKSEKGDERQIYVKPVSSVRNLVYRRWVEHNRALVDSLSGGRVGYVHVEGMNSPSFRRTYEEMLGRHRNCDAIIVDTRFNGGGWLHNDLAVLLSGKEYARFTPRGKYIGSEPFSQWHKPSVMLVNEGNYSDGYGAAYAYQTLGLGDIVGAPIPGTMTAVWWETQIDPSLVFGIPQTTNATVDGTPLENHQLNPEVIIYNNPSELLQGHDAQLQGAVKHLLDKLNATNPNE